MIKQLKSYIKHLIKCGRIYKSYVSFKSKKYIFSVTCGQTISKNDAISDYIEHTSVGVRGINLIIKCIGADSDSIINDLLKTAYNKKQYDCILNESSLRNTIEHKKSSVFNCTQWKNLSFMANYLGLFQVSYALRKKVIEYLYGKNINNMSNDELCDLFRVALDQNDYKIAKKAISKLFGIGIGLFEEAKKAQLFLDLVCNTDKKIKNANKIYTNDDKLFAEYVKDKRIAIVGAAYPKEKKGNEIDEYDLVVRLNYFGEAHLADSEYLGKKTNIAYYSGLTETGKKLLHQKERDFIYDLDFIVQKSKLNVLSISGVKERLAYLFDRFTFQGCLNMMQIVVLDLLMFDIKEIKIFNIDFFLNKCLHYDGYYFLGGAPNIKTVTPSLAYHDVITQINIIRNLWRNNACNVDNNVEKILKMSNESIMSEYSKLFSHPQPPVIL